jgi:hypothetical protein
MNASLLKREIETALGLGPTQAANLWRMAAATGPVAPSGSPVPLPYPNIAVAQPVAMGGAGRRFDGQYVVTGVQHRFGEAGYRNVLACVSAAVQGDPAAARIWPLWVRVKNEIARQPAAVRMQLGHELTHTVQQRGVHPAGSSRRTLRS